MLVNTIAMKIFSIMADFRVFEQVRQAIGFSEVPNFGEGQIKISHDADKRKPFRFGNGKFQ